jgi:hypothetical protein
MERLRSRWVKNIQNSTVSFRFQIEKNILLNLLKLQINDEKKLNC